MVHLRHGLHARQQGGDREDGDLVAQRLQLGAGQHRGAAFLDHVGHQRQVKALANAAHFFFGLGRLDKQNVRPSLGIGLSPAQRFIQAQRGAGIGAGDDQKVFGRARIDGHLDFAHHVGRGDDAPARGMAAFFGELLVFKLDGASACGFVTPDGVAHVEQATVARIGIGNQRRAGHARHGGDAADHVAVSGQTRIGQTHVRGHGAVAGHVQRIKAKAVGQAQRHHVKYTGRDHQTRLVQTLTQDRDF